MAEVPATATPLGSAETAPAFIRAWASVFGDLPRRSEAEWLLALLWNENARGRAIIQHNWGNLSTQPSPERDYWRPPWFDRSKIEAMDEPRRSQMLAIHERMLAGQEPEAFRAWPDHETGAIQWMKSLRRTFPEILEAAKENSAVAMQDAVAEKYCASPACKTIAPSYRSLRNEIRRQGLFSSLPGSSSSAGGGWLVLGGAGLFGLGLWAWAARRTR